MEDGSIDDILRQAERDILALPGLLGEENRDGSIGYRYLEMRRALRLQRPMLRSLFDAVIASDKKQSGRLTDIVAASSTAPSFADECGVFKSVDIGATIRAIEATEADSYASSAYAATVVLVLNHVFQRFLQVFRSDSVLKGGNVEPKCAGYSVAELLKATRNNFHHSDEWARANKLSKCQLASLKPLAALLEVREVDNRYRPLEEIVASRVVLKLASSYDQLEMLVRRAAYNMLDEKGLSKSAFTESAEQEDGLP
jgi:hypothetical protein